MLHPNADSSATVRAVFVINPEGKISAIMYYPLSNGRSVEEIVRLVKALQTTAKHKRATPENRPNNRLFQDKVIVPPASTMKDAEEYPQKYEHKDWYSSGGNTGSLFGIPTFVPGAPRMFGGKVTWSF